MHALCHCLFLPFLTPNANNVELSSTYWKSVDSLFAYNLFNHKADVNKATTQIKIGNILGMFRECDSGHFFFFCPCSLETGGKDLMFGTCPFSFSALQYPLLHRLYSIFLVSLGLVRP